MDTYWLELSFSPPNILGKKQTGSSMSHQLKLCKITDSGILFRGHGVRPFKFNNNVINEILYFTVTTEDIVKLRCYLNLSRLFLKIDNISNESWNQFIN